MVELSTSRVIETTALGAAYLAGLATGFWKSRQYVQEGWQVDRIFEPQMSATAAGQRRERWADAVKRARGWEHASS
jgi:glycerol kinase